MSQTEESYAAQILADAQNLIAKVQGDLDAAAEFYRSNDIDPAKVAPALEQFMGLKQQEELAAINRADQEAIETEVAEAAARASFAAAPAGGARKPRPMV